MTESLEQFLSNVRSSCETHAERKGYKESGGDRNVLGELTKAMGVEAHHAIGEILAKLVEFKAKPRRVLAEKIAGWAWRLWITAPEQDGPFPKLHYHGDCLKKRADGSTYCSVEEITTEYPYPEHWPWCLIQKGNGWCSANCLDAPPTKEEFFCGAHVRSGGLEVCRVQCATCREGKPSPLPPNRSL